MIQKNNYLENVKMHCLEIGAIPSIFDESLSFWDLLCNLVNFLNDKVIKTLNLNTKNINELIDFTNALNNLLNDTITRVAQNEADIKLINEKYNIDIPNLQNQININKNLIENQNTKHNKDIKNLDEKINNETQILQTNINNLKLYTDNQFNEFFISPRFENALDEAFQKYFTDEKIREYLNDDLLNSILLSVKETPKSYENLSSAVADIENLGINQILYTLGYYDANDNGGAVYKVIDNTDESITPDSVFYISTEKSKILELIPINATISDLQAGIRASNTDEENQEKFKTVCESTKIEKILLYNENINIGQQYIYTSKTIIAPKYECTLNITQDTPFTISTNTLSEPAPQLSNYKIEFENINFNFDSLNELKLFNVNNVKFLNIINCKFSKNNNVDNFVILDISNNTTLNLNLKNIKLNYEGSNETESHNISYLINCNNNNILNLNIDNLNLKTNYLNLCLINQNAKPENQYMKIENSNIIIQNISRDSLYIFNAIIDLIDNNNISLSSTDITRTIYYFNSIKKSINNNYGNKLHSLTYKTDWLINPIYSIQTEFLNDKIYTGLLLNINNESSITFTNCLIDYGITSTIQAHSNIIFNNCNIASNNWEDIKNPDSGLYEHTEIYQHLINESEASKIIFNNCDFMNNIEDINPIKGDNIESTTIMNNCLFNSDIILGIPTKKELRSALKIGTTFSANDSSHLGVRKIETGSSTENWITI